MTDVPKGYDANLEYRANLIIKGNSNPDGSEGFEAFA